jgi:hypothetical protein
MVLLGREHKLAIGKFLFPSALALLHLEARVKLQ